MDAPRQHLNGSVKPKPWPGKAPGHYAEASAHVAADTGYVATPRFHEVICDLYVEDDSPRVLSLNLGSRI